MKLTRDCRAFDEVHIETVPRFQTTEGRSEWRINAVVKFKHKGRAVHIETFANAMEAALYLSSAVQEAKEMIPGLYSNTLCQQEGCAHPAVNTYRLKHEYCVTCHQENDAWSMGFEHETMTCRNVFRQFCVQHSVRGNKNREDCDDNHELVKGPGVAETCTTPTTTNSTATE